MRLQVASNADIPDATCTRIGIITTKARPMRATVCLVRPEPAARRLQKCFRRAVDRNLMRRRMRDIFRRHKSSWPPRVDIVIVMNASGAGACAFISFPGAASDAPVAVL